MKKIFISFSVAASLLVCACASTPTDTSKASGAKAARSVGPRGDIAIPADTSGESKRLDAIRPGYGVVLGTFSIKGFLPDKPELQLSSASGDWKGRVKFDWGVFNVKYDIPKRHAKVFVFEVPPGRYRVDGTKISKTMVAPALYIYYHQNFESKTELSFSVEAGKVSYIGDLFFLFESGFMGLAPTVKSVDVTDRYAEDIEHIRSKTPNVDTLKVDKVVAD